MRNSSARRRQCSGREAHHGPVQSPAIERIVDNRLKSAYDEGKFKNLPGQGRPLADIDQPFDEFWWVRKWIQREKLKDAQLRRQRQSVFRRK